MTEANQSPMEKVKTKGSALHRLRHMTRRLLQ